MGLRKMCLGRDVLEEHTPGSGYDVIGMISVYLVVLTNGEFFARNNNGMPITTSNWSEAKMMFGVIGLCEAHDIANRFDGQVYIMNCSKPVPYKN